MILIDKTLLMRSSIAITLNSYVVDHSRKCSQEGKRMRPDLLIRAYQPDDESQVIQLWFRCQLVTAANNPKCDIERKCQVNPEWFLVGLIEDSVVATCMVGYEGHRGWINYLAVDPDYQRQGIATQMMAAAEQLLRASGCPKINLQVRETNAQVIDFYQSIGYRNDRVISLGKRLEHDPPYQNEQDE